MAGIGLKGIFISGLMNTPINGILYFIYMSYNKPFFLLVVFSLVFIRVWGQAAGPKVVYIVDSILVAADPEKGDDLQGDDVSDMTLIRNKDSLKVLGYGQFDAVSYVFTKAYRARPDSIKKTPSTKSMQRKEGVWLFQGNPYTGRIINYYYSGRKQADGWLLNGKVNGVDILYYQNGHTSLERGYKDGRPNGIEREYYFDGSLRQEGRYAEGKEEGVWKSYFPNGQGKLFDHYKAGELVDSAIKYYSNGTVRERVFIKNGKVIEDQRLVKIKQLMTKSAEKIKEEDADAAIGYVLSKNREAEVRTSADKVDIPAADKEKVCSDLQNAVFLGQKSDMITEALANYCQLNSGRKQTE